MKQARVKPAAALLALLVLAVVALAITRPGLANGSQAAQATPAATQAASSDPAEGSEGAFLTINPTAGFPLDPFLVSVQGGGPVEASTLSEDCTGYVAANPTVTVNFQGEADILRAFFYSDGDPTLVVRTPDGAYLCGDNTNSLILDPTVEITKPVTGTYDVWVGSIVSTDLIPGFLVFTTRSDMDAAKLALGSLVKRPAAPDFIPMRESACQRGPTTGRGKRRSQSRRRAQSRRQSRHQGHHRRRRSARTRATDRRHSLRRPGDNRTELRLRLVRRR